MVCHHDPARRVTHPPRRGAGGWTLIETLVAVALTAVLAAVVLSTWLTVHRVLKGRGARVAGPAAAAGALRRLAADLECACVPTDGLAFELKTDARSAVATDLRFFSLADGLSDGARPPRGVADVRYQVVRAGEGRLNLVRIDRPAAGPGALSAGATNLLIDRAESVAVEVFDGTNWMSAWPVRGGQPLPRAARASIAYAGTAGAATARVQTVIQAGVPVAPRFERRLAPAAGR
jgi:type II secretory pathway pseudopilin PulG